MMDELGRILKDFQQGKHDRRSGLRLQVYDLEGAESAILSLVRKNCENCREEKLNAIVKYFDRIPPPDYADRIEWIKKKLPEKENMYDECGTEYCLGYDTGWNTYRAKMLESLGLKE